MAKTPPKRLESQYSQRTIIHLHVKVKTPKKLQQKPSRKMEATKVNAIIKQFNKSDKNRHCRKNNINQFVELFELNDDTDTQHRMKINTPIIVLCEKGEVKG